ncbi:MAG: response regulator, partial [Myxococcales bacterium]|nr:response regulator [Myxococcales bacterium]
MSPSVLILDDDAAFRALVRPALEAQGLDVLEASKGREALRMVREHVPDVLVVDGLLPDTNGMRWIEAVRRELVTVPVVFVSAFFRDLDSYKRLKQDLGCAEVVYKPVSPTDFARRVARLAPQTRTRIRVPSEVDLEVTLFEREESGLSAETYESAGERLSEEVSLDNLFDDVTAADPAPAATAVDMVLPSLRARYAEELPARLRVAVGACQKVRRHPEVTHDREAAIQAVHDLAGTAPSFGFVRVGEAASLLERTLRDIDARQTPDWPTFDRALAVLASDRTALAATVAITLPASGLGAALDASLPLADEPTRPPRVAPERSRLLGPRVLVIDDDPALGEYVASALGDSLALFTHASSFEALGLEPMVESSRVDVRAYEQPLDLDAIDGAFVASPFCNDSGTARVIAHLRQRRPGLPVAILGLEDGWSARREAMAAGADLFIAHPVDDRVLYRALARLDGLSPEPLRVDCHGTPGLSAALEAVGVRARDLADPSAMLGALAHDPPHAVAVGGPEALALLRALRMADGGDEVALLASSGSGAEALEAGADAILPLGRARATVV